MMMMMDVSKPLPKTVLVEGEEGHVIHQDYLVGASLLLEMPCYRAYNPRIDML